MQEKNSLREIIFAGTVAHLTSAHRRPPCVKLRRLLVASYRFLGAVRMQIASRLLLLAASCAVPFAASAQQSPGTPRPITIDDQFQIREVEGPRLSPDAQWVAYTV